MAETMRVILDNFWSWLGTVIIVAVAGTTFNFLRGFTLFKFTNKRRD